jgi:hypothetical protein
MLTYIAIVLLLRAGPFVADAECEDEFHLGERCLALRSQIGSTEFLARTMPGVTEIKTLPGGEFLYRTERSMPFAGSVRTDFRIRRDELTDSSVVFRTPSLQEANFMVLALRVVAEPGGGTVLHARLRVRLIRDDGADIHPLAPVLGEAFISRQMERDLRQTLETFAERISVATPLPPLTEREAR